MREDEKVEAAKKIQKFFRNIIKYCKLREACLAGGNILSLRQKEIQKTAELLPKFDNNRELIEFLLAIIGIKMIRRRNLLNNSPIEILSSAYTPKYMRDNHFQVKKYVADKLGCYSYYSWVKISLIFKNKYIFDVLNIILDNIKDSKYQVYSENIRKYFEKLKDIKEDEVYIEDPKITEGLEQTLNMLGNVPSYYTIIRKLIKEEKFKESNKSNYILMQFTQGLSLEELLDTVNSISQQMTKNFFLNVALSLAAGLDVFKANLKVIKDPLNQQFFYMINSCINLIYLYRDHNHLSRYLYDMLIEEIVALLIYNGDPNGINYTEIVNSLYSERVPIISNHKWYLESFLVSNGMQAIGIAISVSQKSSQKEILELNLNYFEVEKLREDMKLFNAVRGGNDEQVIFVTLEQSHNFRQVDMNSLTDSLEHSIAELKLINLEKHENKFITIIIDITIESGTPKENRLQHLLAKLAGYITDGNINIILVKSLQKYSLLGTVKVMAGNISILNNGDEKFREIKEKIQAYSEDINIKDNKEYPFLIFFMKNAGKFETLMANLAIENANFLKELLGNKIIYARLQNSNSPFIFMSKQQGVAIFDEIVNDYNISEADSFGFLQTTFLKIDEYTLRLNPGIETKEYLTEIFFKYKIYCSINIDEKIKVLELLIGDELLKKILFDNSNNKQAVWEKFVNFEINALLNNEYKNTFLEYLKFQFNGNNKGYKNNKIYASIKYIFYYHLHKDNHDAIKFQELIISEIVKTKMNGLSMEAKKQLRIENFTNHLFRFYNSLQDIKELSGLENLKDPELTEQEFKLKLKELKNMAHNIFFEEDLLMFFLDKKLLDDYKGIAIFNELLSENTLSPMVLFNIIQNFAKENQINTVCGLLLLNKLLAKEFIITENISSKSKDYIFESIKKIISDLLQAQIQDDNLKLVSENNFELLQQKTRLKK